MKIYFLLVIFFVLHGCSTNMSIDSDEVYVGHPIIGSWVYTVNNCNETYTFRENGSRLSTSNEEVVTARYEISSVNELNNTFLLKDEVLQDNGKVDCSGSTSVMTGDVVEVLLFIEQSPDRFSFCFDTQLKNCFGPFLRQK